MVSYISGDEKLFWDRFNVFTALDSALSGFSFLDQVAKDATSTLLLSFLGIVLSLLWFLMTAKARAYIKHWICLAREIEENKLKDLTFFKEECRFKKSLSWCEKAPVTKLALCVPLAFFSFWIARAVISSLASAFLILALIVWILASVWACSN